jgi:epoxyqueuosine reductase
MENVSAHRDLTELVKRSALEAGFDLAGVASFSDFPELRHFSDWIQRGLHGEMRYLERRNHRGELTRISAQQSFPWAHSIVVCALNYNTLPVSRSPLPAATGMGGAEAEVSENAERETDNGSSGWISRYAWSARDYHHVVMERLRRVEAQLHEAAGTPIQTRCYVDTGPLLERVYARYAGIGWVGKNTCLINQQLGSWLFLGLILTSLKLDSGSALPIGEPCLAPDLPAPDRCGTCTRCLDACPTAAFTAPRQLDATRCISYLTIEKRGDIPENLRALMGRHVFGCDICQDVCPWNGKSPVSMLPELQPRPGLVNPALEWLATIGEQEFQEAFRESPVKRAKRSGLRRNAAIATGNCGEPPRFLLLLRQLAQDADETVAKTARWAMKEATSHKQPAASQKIENPLTAEDAKARRGNL